ncbi:hypothetical protein MED121_04468 [Marinomonas sp. MED121]|uniref:hypothetical protein n=1 Tax=Marinomonas sp. MED121 TaxID=314277 RepID=UPI0000690208|nr:hypothetical protein [Marinomonas sp. MED121]EAQ64343.1 hypothetical protein MED121_04468 [Marinomonas sp. MED121]
MRNTVIKNIESRFESMLDIVKTMEPVLLTQQLDIAKSKSVGEHMWCIVGARESYSRALIKGEWDGFSCSLGSDDNLEEIINALNASKMQFEQAVKSLDNWTQSRDELLVSLLEHETMHEGQLIRHIYGLGHSLPDSAKWA